MPEQQPPNPADYSPFPPRRRRVGMAGIAIALLGLGWHVVVLAGLSLDRSPTPDAGAGNLEQLTWYWLSSAAGWLGLTLLWFALPDAAGAGDGPGQSADAGRSTTRLAWRTLILILAVAVVARCIVIVTHAPTLSDDIHRYELDGRTLAHGHNPYLESPAQRRANILIGSPERWPGEMQLLDRVNNSEMHTLYLPVSQFVFAGVGAAIGDAAVDANASARPFRLAFVGFEVLAMLCVARLLRWRGRSPWWLALYAWHPLAVSEIAGSGHQDAIGIALMMIALVIVTSVRSRGAVLLSITPLALAALVKPVTIPIAAFMLRGQPLGRWILAAGIGGVLCVALAAPMMLTHDGRPLANVRASADRFANKWSHFSGVYQPVLAISKVISPIEDETLEWRKKERHERITRGICFALLLLAFVWIFTSQPDLIAATRMLLFAMVLLSTTAHPWYALWALILLPLAPSTALWVASLTLTFGYAALAEPATWEIPAWVFVVAYVPIWITLALDLALRRSPSATQLH